MTEQHLSNNLVIHGDELQCYNPDTKQAQTLYGLWTGTRRDPFAISCIITEPEGINDQECIIDRDLLREIVELEPGQTCGEGDVQGFKQYGESEPEQIGLSVQLPDGEVTFLLPLHGLRTFVWKCYNMVSDSEASEAAAADLNWQLQKILSPQQ